MLGNFSVRSTLAALAFGVAGQANATTFDIVLDYTSPVTANISEAMETAVLIWEYLLPSYASTPRGVSPIGVADPLVITVQIEPIDGIGGILGSAGPDTAFMSPDREEIYTQTGTVSFDSEDLAAGMTFTETVALFVHEIAHVIGFGTLWDVTVGRVTNDLTDSSGEASTQYTGANALAAYQAEVDPLATFIPLEDGGGAGTAGGHWDEAVVGDELVPDDFFGTELMSGIFFGESTAFISETTVASFADIGFETLEGYEAMTIEQLIMAVTPTPVPLPAGAVLLGSGILILGATRRRRKRPAP